MKRSYKVSLALALGLLAVLFVATGALANNEPIVGTWHERDGGTSNAFWFIDEPAGGVYPVLWYDDYTGLITCGDHGPMLWAGLATRDGNTYSGAFGHLWCTENNNEGPHEGSFGDRFDFSFIYNPNTDTLDGWTGCVGTRQPHITTVAKAIHEVEKGRFPPSGADHNVGCDG